MAHKLLTPFKNFPQQLPIFKKSSDKWKDTSLYNYNAVYGILDDVISQSFDDRLHLIALGTKRGDIKIYGSEGVVYTLVGNCLKSVNKLQFLQGQGRLLSVTNEDEIVLWEYKVELSSWEVASKYLLGTVTPNCKITTIEISNPLLWKSDDDDLMELLLLGLNNNSIRQVLIVGNRFHVYDGDDLTVNSDRILSRCPDLKTDYKFGEIMFIKFNSINYDRFFVAFSNGLILFMKSNIEEPKIAFDNNVIAEENEEAKIEVEVLKDCTSNDKIEDDDKQNNEANKESVEMYKEKNKKAENEVLEPDVEKPKMSEDFQNLDQIKVDVKAEVKKVKESVQVPYVCVKLPTIVNYSIKDEHVNAVCWSNNDIVANYHGTNDIFFYNETVMDDSKQVRHHEFISLNGDISLSMSHLSNFKRNDSNIFSFVSKTESSPNLLCLVTDNHIDVEFEPPSNIIDYVIVKDQVTEDNQNPDARTLLIICESQLIAVDLTSESYTELKCPYLALRNNSHITCITSVLQVFSALFPDHKSNKELFRDWILNTPISSNTTSSKEYLDIIATGHCDGAIYIWQILPSGVLSVLKSINNSDLFKDISISSNLITEKFLPRRQVGQHLIKSDDTLLRISNIQLIVNSIDTSNDASKNELFCVAGNCSGTAVVLKFGQNNIVNNLVEITSNIKDCHEKEYIIWNDSEAPELLECSEISCHVPDLSHIIKLNPSLPVTALAFKPNWNLLAVGCTYGFVLVDLKQSETIFSYSTLVRAPKNSIISAPLTVGQQFKKSMRQSFRKLKKLKPSSKHTYTVNDEKSKNKDKNKEKENEDIDKDKENNPEANSNELELNVVDDEKKVNEGEIILEKDDYKEKVVDYVKTSTVEEIEAVTEVEIESPMEISRKDKPSGTIGTLLIEATNLVSAIKEPCLFAGTNIGAIYAFELKFGFDGPVSVTLSKELHLQHKAPVLLISIIDSNHVPLVCKNEVSVFERKCSVVEVKSDNKHEETNDSPVVETGLELGPSGDTDQNDAKLKSGTLPAPSKSNEDGVEKTEPSRKSVDAGKNKSMSPNTTMKKSGTLPASFLQAIGKTSGNSDSHELLVVSEEQVKLFSLPSLKAKYKYKVVDTGHHFGHIRSNNIQETEHNVHDKKSDYSESNTVESLIFRKQTRRIATVGFCKVPNFKQSPIKWGVSIALTNGEIIALTLNNLKKYLSNLYNVNCPIVVSLSNGETSLVVSMTKEHNIQITDFSLSGTHYFEPVVSIEIPLSTRPVIKVVEKVEPHLAKVEEASEKIKSEDDKDESALTNGYKSDHMNGHAEAHEIEEGKDNLGKETIVTNSVTTHHGDVTMDSIKEYITNMDGNITVKTFDSSTEKQVPMNGTDGEIMNDESRKIVSETVSNE